MAMVMGLARDLDMVEVEMARDSVVVRDWVMERDLDWGWAMVMDWAMDQALLYRWSGSILAGYLLNLLCSHQLLAALCRRT